ncbi:MAG: cache domain-containing protein [Planctomycetota bacterium]|jgi:two-component system sensor histidine kinase/response regulator
MPRTVSIRRSLLVNLIVVIALLGGAIMATTFFGARRAVRTLSRALIDRTIDQTEARLEHFFAPVITNLRMVRSWGEAGMIDTDDPAAINRRLVPIMKHYPQITSVMVADDRGREHMVLRTGAEWINRQSRRDEWGSRTRWLTWSDEAPQPTESWGELDYDPRTRPWFTGAVERHRTAGDVDADQLVHWTEPYIFFTTKDPGITASVTLNTPDSPAENVIGFDVLLNDISTFTATLQPSENGLAFVLTGDGRLIGLPRAGHFSTPEARAGAVLERPRDVDAPVVADAAGAYWEQPPDGRAAFRFSSEGAMWWGGVRTFPLAADRDLMIGVVVPEADLLGNLTQMRTWIILITAAVLAGAIVRAVVLARGYSRPIEALVRQSHRISRGDLEPASVIDEARARPSACPADPAEHFPQPVAEPQGLRDRSVE